MTNALMSINTIYVFTNAISYKFSSLYSQAEFIQMYCHSSYKWSTATMNDVFASGASWITDISESVKEHRSFATEVIEA